MKKILVLIVILLLVGCQQNEQFQYESTEEVSIKWLSGENVRIDDPLILEALHSLLNEQELTEVEQYKVEAYEILIGETSIRGNQVKIDELNYEFAYISMEDLSVLLQDYLIKEDNQTSDDDQKTVLDLDLEDYTFLASLKDGTKVYYHLSGTYAKKELVDEIVLFNESEILLQETGQFSLPQLSEDKEKLAYVSGVGFEFFGTISVYENQELTIYDTSKLLRNLSEERTIKSCEWFGNQLLAIVGYPHGTITLGGDLYLVDLEKENVRLLLDAGKGLEIVTHTYADEQLTFTMVSWLDDNYQYTRYFDTQVSLTDLSQFPLRLSWSPWNLQNDVLVEEEILANSLFNPNLKKSDLSSLDSEDQEAFYGDGYSVHFKDDQLWRIEVTASSELVRGIMVGQTLGEILEKFPHPLNYLEEEDGSFYKDDLNQGYFENIQNGHRLTFKTNDLILTLDFSWDKLIKANVYFFSEDSQSLE